MNSVIATLREWLRRHPRVRRPSEAVTLVLVGLALVSQFPRLFTPGTSDYSIAQDTVFLSCVAAVLLALLLKPSSMWVRLKAGIRGWATQRVPTADEGLASLVALLICAVALVSATAIEWRAIRLSRGLGAVVAVNLVFIIRQLFAKYSRGSGSHQKGER